MGEVIRDLSRGISLDAGATDFINLMRIRLLARKAGLTLPLVPDVAIAQGLSHRVKGMLADPNLSQAMMTARATAPPPGTAMMTRVHPMTTKTAVPPTLVADLDYLTVSTAFLVSTGQFSAFERILADRNFLMTPLRAWVRVMTSDPVGSTVAESRPTPVLRLTAAVKKSEPVKAQALAAFSDEAFLLNPAEANTLIGTSLKKAVGRAVDTEFLALATAGASSAASSGLTPTAVLSDLSAVLATITFGADAKLYAIVPATAYTKLTLANASGLLAFPQLGLNGGRIGNVTVIPTDLGSDGIVLDASQIAASDGGLESDISKEACLEEDDNPTLGSPSKPVSMLQTNQVAMKLTRYFSCTPLRDHVAAKITGMA
jgi:hypothetical protein